MSILKNKIRWWWIEKPTENNLPIQAVFEAFQPTIRSRPETEWVRVISLDDFHKEAGMNITRWVEICQQLNDIREELKLSQQQNEIYRKALERINNFYTPIESVKEMATEALQDAQKLAGGK